MLKALLITKVYFQFPVNFRNSELIPNAKKIKDNTDNSITQKNIPKQGQSTITTQGKITLT